MSNNSEKFFFSVDSALLGELGERLVSSVHVALTELVKNAYDADASYVSINISTDENGSARVIVEDDGLGMNIDQVRSYWMKIGTTNKLDQPTSMLYGRPKTGSKGIGRFACRRLGHNLLLKTIAKISQSNGADSYQSTEVTFEWDKFVPGTTVEHIECDGLISTLESGKAGTRLEIWGGDNNEWTVGGLRFLKRQLAILASNMGTRRKGFEEDPGFNIRLTASDFDEEVVDLREEIVEASWGTLTAEVDSEGRAQCCLTAKGLGTKTFTSTSRFLAVAGAKLKLGILPLTKKEDARKPEILPKYAMSEISNEWGGVQVRYNGFRMFPYGDARDDWLGIDADRGRRLAKPDEELFTFASARIGVDPARALLNMLSMRSHFGYVEVTNEIEGLYPKIDRQGFLENPTFDALRAFARFCIDWASIWRDYFVNLKRENQAEIARFHLEEILDEPLAKEILMPKATSYLRKEVSRLITSLPENQRARATSDISKTLDAIELRSEANQNQLEHLRLIASSSTLTILFAHEIRTVVGSLGASSELIKRIATKLDGKDRDDLLKASRQMEGSQERFNSLIEMTGIVGAFNRESSLEEINLKYAVNRAVKCFEIITKSYSIHVDTSNVLGNAIVGPMISGELYAVLINLLSNSIKSVIAASPSEKRIEFQSTPIDGKVQLKVLDNGLGLEEKYFKDVFTPFISDPTGNLYSKLQKESNPQDTLIFGTGSGLGLSIVKDILTSRKGSIKFVSPPLSWSTCIEVILP